ncbi:rhodanese-like domain-containing protein [Curvibacter sp. APW13]|uniref:rhodanese-like domain-containing protein n=1 Tax=Curvibacter sp. APW13 TaxID=3077236 RepID=UPI0028DF1B96|nr:rhodanese-like domain-containing protein [Curvibacter sp. APW13]MDT8990366.1 rhodanese-like domain-containing protein [Curvibacter sp. APW13]
MSTLLRSTLAALLFAASALSATAKEVVIDVRTPQEFASGHIAGAINIDHALIGQEIGKAKVSKDDTVILYCRSGRRSELALETLRKMGYSKAQNYGGIDEAAKRLQKKP